MYNPFNKGEQESPCLSAWKHTFRYHRQHMALKDEAVLSGRASATPHMRRCILIRPCPFRTMSASVVFKQSEQHQVSVEHSTGPRGKQWKGGMQLGDKGYLTFFIWKKKIFLVILHCSIYESKTSKIKTFLPREN